MMFGMHFDNASVLLNSVAAPYVHLATSSITFTCLYVYTAKIEIHTQLKKSEVNWPVGCKSGFTPYSNWHYNKVESHTKRRHTFTKKKMVIIHSLRCFLIDVKFGLSRFYPLTLR